MKKVYSWKTLFATVFLGVGFFVYRILHFKDFMDLLWLALLAYLIIQGLFVSFSKDAYEADIERASRGKKMYRKLFGKFAPFAPYGSLMLFLLSWIVAMLLPDWQWLILTFLFSAVIYAIWLGNLCKKYMKIEEEQEKWNDTK